MKKTDKKLCITILDFDQIRNPLLSGGQAWATYEIGRRLVRKNYHISVISSRYPGSADQELEGITYKHIGLGSSNIRLNNLAYIICLPLTVRKIQADIILECFTAPISTLLSPLFTGIPVVGISTSFEADRFSRQYHLPFYLVEKFGCRLYRYFIASAPNLNQKMKQFNPRIISHLVGQGVADGYFKIKPDKARHILYLGRFDIGQKGLDLLLEAYAKIAGRIPWPLVIAGRGPDEKKLLSIISDLHLKDRVILAGAVYGDKKAELLSRTQVVAIPSRSEGFSLFALEAFAAGVPVVSFDIPGLSWITTGVALKAKPYNTTEFAGLIVKASDEKINKLLRQSVRNFARKFSWDNVVDEYEKFFRQIMELEGKKYVYNAV